MSRSIADRPTIHLIDTEQARLLDLARAMRSRQAEISELLQEELERAEVHDAASLPPGVVSMHSTVEFLDESNGTSRTVQLVYPHEADIAAGRISVLTPIGAGLIGLSEGQSILWPNRAGQERQLRIIKVTRATGAV